MIAGSDRDECDGLRFDSPDDVAVVWGAKAKPPVLSQFPGGFADRTVNGGSGQNTDQR
jgi:hypothetical protein